MFICFLIPNQSIRKIIQVTSTSSLRGPSGLSPGPCPTPTARTGPGPGDTTIVHITIPNMVSRSNS